MRFRKNHYLAILVITLLSFKLQAQTNGSYPQGIAHVVVIGVDGLSPDGIRKAKTPVMHKMIAGGAVKWNVRTVLPSSSSPNWASMLMGAGPEIHGILDNSWEKEELSLPPIVSGKSGLFPTIFSVIRAAKPEAAIGAIYQWGGFGRLFEQEAVSHHKSYSTEDSTAAEFLKYILLKKPSFAFVQLDDVDGAGHGSGHGTAAYYQAVNKVDYLIGTLLAGIKNAGMLDNTLFIVVSDHGGLGYGHGGPSVEEAEVAMIFYGKGIKKGYQIKQQVYTYDLAASIAFAMQIVPPYAWTGRPVKSAFTGFNEPENLWTGKEIIPRPVIYPDKNLFAQPGGLYIDEAAMVKMDTVAEKSTIRYTTDGSQPKLSSTIYKQPFVLNETAVVKARSFDRAGNESLTATAYFRLLKTNQGNGLNTSFYIGKNWSRLPFFKELKASKTWVSHEFNLNRDHIQSLLDKDNNTFAASFNGYIEIDQAGEYTFYTQSDDGSQLFINSQKVVDNDESHGVVEKSGTIQLQRGRHEIKVFYFNEAGGFWLDAFYKGPGISKQLIPADRLFLKN